MSKKLKLNILSNEEINEFLLRIYELKRIKNSPIYYEKGDSTFFGESIKDTYNISKNFVTIEQSVRVWKFPEIYRGNIVQDDFFEYFKRNISNKHELKITDIFHGDGSVTWFEIELKIYI